jgi:hypothetical protein
VRADGWPAVFAFVYDDLWSVVRGPWLRGFLGALLGPGYRQNSHLWLFRLLPERSASGWPPHADGPERPDRVTVWIPLTDATLDNGCMYVVPQDRVPASIPDFTRVRSVDLGELQVLLQSSRALPAAAGSVLGWNHRVIHWGSACGRPEHPRVSLSVEFVAAGTRVFPDEAPALAASPTLPPLADRLRAIARGVLSYDRFDPTLFRFTDVAKALLSRVGRRPASAAASR